MTRENFQEVKDKIVAFCEKHNLKTETSSEWHEYDFVMDAGYEAIDCHTLENPTCITTEQYILVELPQYQSPLSYEERCEYSNIVLGLGAIAQPDYLIGAESGICKGIMYCVWAA